MITYDANNLPDSSTPAWTKVDNAEVCEISPAGYLHLKNTPSWGENPHYYLEDTGLNSSVGITVEARIKILDGSPDNGDAGPMSLTIRATDGVTPQTGIDFYKTMLEGTWGGGPYTFDTTDDYHIYTITLKDGTGTLYIDGIWIGGISVGTGATQQSVRFDVNVPDVPSYNSEVSIDYIKIWNDGLHPPTAPSANYEANELPEDATPVWTKQLNAPNLIEEISPAGFLHIKSDTDSYPEYIRNLSAPLGITVETKMKVISGEINDYEGDNINGCSFLNVAGADRKCDLFIYSDGVSLTGQNVNTVPFDTTDDYHIYRITIDATTLNLYIDGVLVATDTPDNYTYSMVEFSPEIMGRPNIETSWDYVHYRCDGAFPPEVEPVTANTYPSAFLKVAITDVCSIYHFLRTGETETYDTEPYATNVDMQITPANPDLFAVYPDVPIGQLFDIFSFASNITVATGDKIISNSGKKYIVRGVPAVYDVPNLGIYFVRITGVCMSENMEE